eukprot:gene3353-4204_t
MKEFKVVGVMSGTSADAIDIVVCKITVENYDLNQLSTTSPSIVLADQLKYSVHQIAFEKVDWSNSSRELIFMLFDTRKSTIQDLSEANFILGKEIAEAINQILHKNKIPNDSIDIIGSHGQTIWHNVNEVGKVTSTLQIADISVISNLTGITTIGDFRTADVALGGQGAPFAGILDTLVLRKESGSYCRAIQNIGGIGNVTFLPSKEIADKYPLVQFDTGPGNVLIDWIVDKISNGKLKYDDKGMMARTGKVLEEILDGMMEHEYFKLKPPKSTGRELFSFQYAEKIYKTILEKYGGEDKVNSNDIIATFTEFTALSISQSYIEYSPCQIDEVFIAGGGSRNDFLLERIEFHLNQHYNISNSKLPKITVKTHESLGIDGEAKEGILFALLAVLNILGVEIDLRSLTGCKSNSVTLGKLSPGKNYHRLIRSTLN